jgi:endonuclease/exonuclease/phosphatase family metal-dependent hydrolase
MKLRLFKRWLLVGLIAVYVVVSGQALAASQRNYWPVVKVMTQNLYLGADLDIILEKFDPDEPEASLLLFLQAVQSTNFSERAEALAQEIQRQKPDVIGLQEASLFELLVPVPEAPPIRITIADYKQILLDALQARNLNYVAAVTSQNAVVTSPVPLDVDGDDELDGYVRVTDQDAILVRRGVRISDVETREFSTLRVLLPPIPGFGFPIWLKRGYVALDISVRGKTYRFVNTHLETKGDNPVVQEEQATELISALDDEQLAVILLGDFNSGPSDGHNSPYAQLSEAGYIDAWSERLGPRRNSDDPGFTCCQDKSLLNPVSELDKRVDLIWVSPSLLKYPSKVFGRAIISKTVVIGDEPQDRTPTGLWPSDHAGVVSKLHVR